MPLLPHLYNTRAISLGAEASLAWQEDPSTVLGAGQLSSLAENTSESAAHTPIHNVVSSGLLNFPLHVATPTDSGGNGIWKQDSTLPPC